MLGACEFNKDATCMHASVNYGVCLSLDVIYTFYFFMKKKKLKVR